MLSQKNWNTFLHFHVQQSNPPLATGFTVQHISQQATNSYSYCELEGWTEHCAVSNMHIHFKNLTKF